MAVDLKTLVSAYGLPIDSLSTLENIYHQLYDRTKIGDKKLNWILETVCRISKKYQGDQDDEEILGVLKDIESYTQRVIEQEKDPVFLYEALDDYDMRISPVARRIRGGLQRKVENEILSIIGTFPKLKNTENYGKRTDPLQVNQKRGRGRPKKISEIVDNIKLKVNRSQHRPGKDEDKKEIYFDIHKYEKRIEEKRKADQIKKERKSDSEGDDD